MGNIKERDYMFDTFRGLLILSIPMSHFTKVCGNMYGELFLNSGFPKESLCGFVYITINVFVMQAFMFLSGYFSKKPDRAQETAFSTFMWPYLVFTVIYYFIRIFFFGNANLSFLSPPFALWFLFVLFFFRFFLKYMSKYKWLLPVSIVMYFMAGQIEEFGSYLALGRAASYFPFFLIGYYCSKERLAKVQQLRKKPAVLVILAAALVAMTFVMMYHGPAASWFLLKESVHSFNLLWWQDALSRLIVFMLACGWITLMVNIIPSKKNFLSYVGVNTMPVYVFHLTLRYVIEFYGLYVGFIACLTVAWFAILSLIYKKHGNAVIYGVTIVISAVVIIWMYSSGCLQPLYGLCPENKLAFYLLLYGGAITAGLSFVAPFWIKLYDLLIDGPLRGSSMTRWLQKTWKTDQSSDSKQAN